MSERDDAITELGRRVQANVEPVLDTVDLESIIDSPEVRRAYRWEANKVFPYGAVVLPTTESGFIFTVITAGKSGTIEPGWPTESGDASTVSDGSITYLLGETHLSSIYDMRTAAGKGWMLKLAKASEYMKSDDGDEQAIYEHIKYMAEGYRRPLVA